MPTFTDFVLQPSAAVVGVWVRLVNNATAATFVSTAATTASGSFTAQNVPAGIYTLSTGPTSGGPFTAIDTAYLVAPGPSVVDITDFGGKGDGATDNSAAFTAAVAALPATGGTIFFPASASAYFFASGISLSGKSFVRLRGAGPARSGGAGPASRIQFTTTTGPLINLNGTLECALEDLFIQWPNAFAARVVDLSSSTFGRIAGCSFFATGGGSAAGLIVGFENSTRVLIERNVFQNANTAIQGLNSGGDFANKVTIRDNNFSTAQPNGTISNACIRNVGQGWTIADNTFEMGQLQGNAVVVATSAGTGGLGVDFSGNWIGDAGANAVSLISIGSGWIIDGNYIGGSAASTAISVPNNAAGIAILGNEFATHSVALLIGTTVNRIIYAGNVTASGSTEISGTPNSGGQILISGTQTLYGAAQVNGGFAVSGTMTLQGAEIRSTRGPAFVTPFTPDATIAERTEMTLTGALTVNAPANGAAGQVLELWWNQGAGGFATTYNAAYKTTGWPAITTTASTLTIDIFHCARDGVTWRLVSRVTGQT